MSTIFFSQNLLDALIEEGRIRIDSNVMTLLTKDPHSFTLEPAYRILKLVSGGVDELKLINTVKTESDLKKLNAEVYQNSIIIDNAAYEAESGFLGDQQNVVKKLSDTELLSRFVLENLL